MPRLRPAAALSVLGLALLPAVAGSHSGHAPPTVTVGTFKFAPQQVQAYAGDTVIWLWSGPDTNHSVTADDGSFDSDPGKAPSEVRHDAQYGFTATFPKAGTYTYHCKVHPQMTGSVVVSPVAPVNPKRPRLTGLRVSPTRLCGRASRHCAHPGAVVRFTVDQRADVQIVVTRRSNRRTLREMDVTGRKGANRFRVDFGRLRPGPYAIRVVAVNPRTGRSSKRLTANVRLRP
jgi:plastocyanin